MAKLKGRDVSVAMEIDGGGLELIAMARDADIDVSCDVAEFTSPLSGRGKRCRAGRYSWTVNVGTLIDASDQPGVLLELLKSGGALTLTMDADLLNQDSKQCTLQGDAVVQKWQLGAPLQGLATFSVSFIGDGELKMVPKRSPSPSPRG
jgi:predicted secreted protein